MTDFWFIWRASTFCADGLNTVTKQHKSRSEICTRSSREMHILSSHSIEYTPTFHFSPYCFTAQNLSHSLSALSESWFGSITLALTSPRKEPLQSKLPKTTRNNNLQNNFVCKLKWSLKRPYNTYKTTAMRTIVLPNGQKFNIKSKN